MNFLCNKFHYNPIKNLYEYIQIFKNRSNVFKLLLYWLLDSWTSQTPTDNPIKIDMNETGITFIFDKNQNDYKKAL